MCAQLQRYASSTGRFTYHETMTLFTATLLHAAIVADARSAAGSAVAAAIVDVARPLKLGLGQRLHATALSTASFPAASDAANSASSEFATFATFAAAHRELLDPRLYQNFYSDELMCNTPDAALRFFVPDIQQLPSVVV
jgi:hypothetical protein